MKKLFTLCASALLAFTLSAQAEAEGSYYLSTGDATQFVKSNGVAFDNLSLGYAVQDDLVIMGTVNNLSNDTIDNTFDLGVRYFMDGIYVQGTIHNATSETDRNITLGVGTLYSLGNVFEGEILGNMYLDPSLSINSDREFSTSMGIGYRF